MYISSSEFPSHPQMLRIVHSLLHLGRIPWPWIDRNSGNECTIVEWSLELLLCLFSLCRMTSNWEILELWPYHVPYEPASVASTIGMISGVGFQNYDGFLVQVLVRKPCGQGYFQSAVWSSAIAGILMLRHSGHRICHNSFRSSAVHFPKWDAHTKYLVCNWQANFVVICYIQ